MRIGYKQMQSIYIQIILTFVFIYQFSCFDFTLDAYGTECFTEQILERDNIEVAYEVVDGGFLDVDLTIIGPGKKVIQKIQRKASGHYIVKATQPGLYEFCFGNEHSTITDKVIVFNINLERPPKFDHGATADNKTQEIEMAMYTLASKTAEMRRGQEFMDVRDETHSRLNIASHSMITYWSVFECILFSLVSIAQIWYLRRFFEVRRVV